MARGRLAHSPLTIPKAGWMDIGWRIWRGFGKHRIALIAAGVAFYGLLSLFPAITAAVAIVGLAYDASMLLDQSAFLLNALPDAAAELISGQIAQVSNSSTDTLGLAAIISIALALWSASKAMDSLIQGLNIIYNEEEERGFVQYKATVLGLTFALLVTLSSAVIIVAAIPATLVLLGAAERWADLALLLRWPLMFALGVLMIAVLYRFAPSRRAATWRWLSPGALLACILWVTGSYAFSAYVQSFGAYNETFGTLAGVVILLTWLWLSAFVVFLGALLDAELEAQTARDTTVGPDRPMGERGAYKADNLGERFREDPSS